MNLEIQNQVFLVGGATSGFGKAVTEALIAEGAHVIAFARGDEKLKVLQSAHSEQVETVSCDITQAGSIDKILERLNNRPLHGIFLNAGGPPAMTTMEAKMEDWDSAYNTVLRWKIELTQSLVPIMIERKYGRIVYLESASVKQPMENLVLSNSMRLAVVGYVKTLSQEIAGHGITLNVLAPGSHATAAMERIFKKKIEQTGLSKEEVRKQYEDQTNVGFLGRPEDLASLATWLLSPHSRYITGQTISVDGGTIKGVMG